MAFHPGLRACDQGLHLDRVAEGVGFEPTVTCATTVFETVRFGRSRTPPRLLRA